ncbi:lamin tail domain-containing protein [Candidatus Viridilinea mediisalina]|uniref:LTD domain-containing protein n=1 Tax=Candidatus Viridilinea mediisalina TaxID=2024553 RepID=A0A2A6RJX3_9CHLR|nr:lamin tail domain-containing protein [Candidatus Viridilinea mediisalina]PDW03170.1 hypothetical protein CJ255_10175 [Candidatus Viridilinea mediisalina]
MSQETPKPPRQQTNPLIGTIESAAVGVGRFGYGLLSLGLGLLPLPQQTRTQVDKAVRELSYGVVTLPRDFADIAAAEVDRWDSEATTAPQAHAGAAPAAPKPAAEAKPAPPPPAPKPATPPPAPKPAAEAKPAPPPPAPKPAAEAKPTPPPPAPQPATPPPAPKPAAEAKPTPPPPAPKPAAEAKPATPPPAPKPAAEAKPATPPPAPKPAAETKPAAATPEPANITIGHLEYSPSGRHRDSEYVLMRNSGNAPVDMTGWTLSDGTSRNTFTFPPRFTLAAGAEVKLWTRSGNANAGNLYWANRSAIWSNSGDTATLRDAQGNVIARYTYQGKPKGRR